MMRILFLLINILVITSCQTIRFSKTGRDIASHKEVNKSYKFHHIGILGLIEFSEPVSPKKICGKEEFVSVQTEMDLKTWAINFVGQIVTGGILGLIYTPQAVTVFCDSNKTMFAKRKRLEKRNLANEYESINFKVLKVNNNKALVKFLRSSAPPRNSIIHLDDFEDFKIKVLRSGKKKAILYIRDLKLQTGVSYQGSL